MASDVHFLRRIFQKAGKKKNKPTGEKYFELNCNCALIE